MFFDFTKPSFYDNNSSIFPKFNFTPPDNVEDSYLLTPFERRIPSYISSFLKPNSVYVEIGCLSSWNLINVYLSNPKLNILAIDMFEYDPSYKPYNKTPLYVYKMALFNLKRHNLLFKIPIIRGNSKEFINILPNNSVDCVFIDGDHSYDGCLNDIIEMIPKLKSNSILFGHDSRNIEVKNAVDFIFSNSIIKTPWGNQRISFSTKIMDIAKEYKINDANNGIWFAILNNKD